MNADQKFLAVCVGLFCIVLAIVCCSDHDKPKEQTKYSDSIQVVSNGIHYTIPARVNEKNR